MTAEEEVISTLFAANEEEDYATVERLYAEDIAIWHSFDQVSRSKAEGLLMFQQIVAVGNRKYELIERLSVGRRVIQRHVMTITSKKSGRKYDAHVAIFFTVMDGKIVRTDEYIDAADVAGIMKAMREIGITSVCD